MFITSHVHQLSRALKYDWTYLSLPGWHSIRLITYMPLLNSFVYSLLTESVFCRLLPIFLHFYMFTVGQNLFNTFIFHFYIISFMGLWVCKYKYCCMTKYNKIMKIQNGQWSREHQSSDITIHVILNWSLIIHTFTLRRQRRFPHSCCCTWCLQLIHPILKPVTMMTWELRHIPIHSGHIVIWSISHNRCVSTGYNWR